MIRDQLATGSVTDWQSLALIFFIVLFLIAVIFTFRRGKRDTYESYKDIPFENGEFHTDAHNEKG